MKRKLYALMSVALLICMLITAVGCNTTDTNAPATDAPATDAPITKPTEKPTEPEATEKPTGSVGGSVSTGNKIPSFILPVSGKLTNKHDPTLQVFSPTMQDYRVHIGVDLATKESAPVYAAADGKISKIWVDTLMGYCIAIKHSGDCVTVYKNLAENLPEGIAEGVSVRSGQLIATVGESAMVEIADEPHLHFEMTVGELAVDPLEYFDESALESAKKEEVVD